MELRRKFINWALLAVGVVFLFLATRLDAIIDVEESIVDFIVDQIPDETDCTACEMVSATEIIGSFLNPRREYNESVFTYGERSQEIQNSPITTVIVNGGGSCGYSSELGVRVFERLGYSARFVQVLDSQKQTRHVVMDAEKDGVYGVIDPIFGHLHLDSLGNFASLEYLSQHWAQVKETLPQDSKIGLYPYGYGIQFTNWKGVGVFSTSIQKVLTLAGFDVQGVCLRVWFNQLRRIMPKILFVLSMLSFSILILRDSRFSKK